MSVCLLTFATLFTIFLLDYEETPRADELFGGDREAQSSDLHRLLKDVREERSLANRMAEWADARLPAPLASAVPGPWATFPPAEAGARLAMMGPDALSAEQDCQEMLSSDHLSARFYAALLLARMSRHVAEVVETQRRLALDKNAAVRTAAMLVLAECGPAATNALPEVEGVLAQPDYSATVWAALVVARLAPRSQSALPLLEEKLDALERPQGSEARHPWERCMMALAAGRLTGDSSRFRSALAELMDQNDPERTMTLSFLCLCRGEGWINQEEFVWNLARAMAAYHERPKPTWSTRSGSDPELLAQTARDLTRFIEANDEWIEEMAALDCARYLALDGEVDPDFIKQWLFTRNYQEGELLVQILGQATGESTDAGSEIARHLASPSPRLRLAAARALWKVTGETGTVMPVLLTELESDSLCARHRAGSVIMEIGPPALSQLSPKQRIAAREAVALDAEYPSWLWYHIWLFADPTLNRSWPPLIHAQGSSTTAPSP